MQERLVDKLVDECSENIDDEAEIVSEYKNKCNSCILYILLVSIFFTTNIGIATCFAFYKFINRNKENVSVYDYVYQGKNY